MNHPIYSFTFNHFSPKPLQQRPQQQQPRLLQPLRPLQRQQLLLQRLPQRHNLLERLFMKLINSCLALPKWNFSNFMNVSTEIFNPLIEKKISRLCVAKEQKARSLT